MNEKTESLGTCCLCETDRNVRNILALPKKSPTPGTGWGCAVCDLPADGAMAVVCDDCLKLIEGGARPKFACRGTAGVDGRVRIEELTGEHAHDQEKHHEDARRRTGFALGGHDFEALCQTVTQVEIDGVLALQLLGALQLVARHPNFRGPTAIGCLSFARFLQEQISVTPNLAKICAAGWLSKHDQPVIEVPENQSRIILPEGR